ASVTPHASGVSMSIRSRSRFRGRRKILDPDPADRKWLAQRIWEILRGDGGRRLVRPAAVPLRGWTYAERLARGRPCPAVRRASCPSAESVGLRAFWHLRPCPVLHSALRLLRLQHLHADRARG